MIKQKLEREIKESEYFVIMGGILVSVKGINMTDIASLTDEFITKYSEEKCTISRIIKLESIKGVWPQIGAMAIIETIGGDFMWLTENGDYEFLDVGMR